MVNGGYFDQVTVCHPSALSYAQNKVKLGDVEVTSFDDLPLGKLIQEKVEKGVGGFYLLPLNRK